MDRDDVRQIDVPTKSRPALAALALYGQLFGFTHEDVTQLRLIVNEIVGKTPEAAGRVWNLAARIEALLPPKKL